MRQNIYILHTDRFGLLLSFLLWRRLRLGGRNFGHDGAGIHESDAFVAADARLGNVLDQCTIGVLAGQGPIELHAIAHTRGGQILDRTGQLQRRQLRGSGSSTPEESSNR